MKRRTIITTLATISTASPTLANHETIIKNLFPNYKIYDDATYDDQDAIIVYDYDPETELQYLYVHYETLSDLNKVKISKMSIEQIEQHIIKLHNDHRKVKQIFTETKKHGFEYLKNNY